jgi:DNA-binding transcriptional MerR regulator
VYTARDVAQICGLTESRVRYWAQTGVVSPSERKAGRGVYSFQDVVGVKTAKELLDKGLSLQAVRKNLDALKAQLPAVSQPLAELRVVSDGDRLVVLAGGAAFEPASGQLLLDFSIEPIAAELAALPAPEKQAARAETAYSWFLAGMQATDDDQALIAYQKALEGDPLLAAAHCNVGTLLHRRGALTEARAAFERALSLDPEQPEARYNLANLCDELGERTRAIAEWTRVVVSCPEFADAHFNLASAFVEEGATVSAKSHLKAYLRLDPDGEWALKAKEVLKSI